MRGCEGGDRLPEDGVVGEREDVVSWLAVRGRPDGGHAGEDALEVGRALVAPVPEVKEVPAACRLRHELGDASLEAGLAAVEEQDPDREAADLVESLRRP